MDMQAKQPESFILYTATIDTKLGPMITIGSDSALYLLEFTERRGLDRELERLKQKTKATILPGRTPPLVLIEQELTDYFDGKLQHFTTPILMMGSEFQQKVCKALNKIPPAYPPN